MDGLLVVDKPGGPTSHDVVARMRRALGERRIGHTGTLDPAATGVLCLVLGRATRLARFLSASDKSYEAVVRFGFATDTGDAHGRMLGALSTRVPSREAVETALDAFRGTFLQQPPAFSAKKIGGKRSHQLARAQSRNTLPGPPAAPALPALVNVTVHRLEVVSQEATTVTLRVDCSAGFYVRSLAHDLGERLGVGAHLASLRRTRSGDFTLEQGITLDEAERDTARAVAAVTPMADMLPVFPVFRLSSEGVTRAANGCQLDQRDGTCESPIQNPESPVRLLSPLGELIGVARRSGSTGFLHPIVVLM